MPSVVIAILRITTIFITHTLTEVIMFSKGVRLRTAILKTGEEVPESVVKTANMNLQSLMDTNRIAFTELVTFSRDPKHTMPDNTQVVAKRLVLLRDNGTMNDWVRAIILSSVEGDGMNMTLVDPLISRHDSGNSSKP